MIYSGYSVAKNDQCDDDHRSLYGYSSIVAAYASYYNMYDRLNTRIINNEHGVPLLLKPLRMTCVSSQTVGWSSISPSSSRTGHKISHLIGHGMFELCLMIELSCPLYSNPQGRHMLEPLPMMKQLVAHRGDSTLMPGISGIVVFDYRFLEVDQRTAGDTWCILLVSPVIAHETRIKQLSQQ